MCKLVINKESEFDIVSSTLVKNLNLPLEALPYPYEIPWLNNTSLMVTHSCMVPFMFGKYKFFVSFDVLPMDVADILLGQPWMNYLNGLR